jgi:signal transduction histidine kinase
LASADFFLTDQELAKLRSGGMVKAWYQKEETAYLLQAYPLTAEASAWAWIPLLEVPKYLSWSLTEKSTYVPLNLKNGPKVYIKSGQAASKSPLPLLFLWLSTLCFWIAAQRYLSNWLQLKEYRLFLWGLAGTTSVLFLLTFIWININSQTDLVHLNWAVYQPFLSATWSGPSPLAVLWQAAIFLWLLTQFYRLFGAWEIVVVRLAQLRAHFFYVLSLLLLAGVTYWLKYVVLESNTVLNLEATLEITSQGLLVALSLVFLLSATFMYVFRLFKLMANWGLSFLNRLTMMLFALLVSVPFMLYLDLGFSIWIWFLMAFIFLMLFDLLADGEAFNFTWLMVWMIMMSAFAASLSYKYVLAKDLETMQGYSSSLLAMDSNEVVLLGQMEYLPRYAYLIIENGQIQSSQQFITTLDWEDLIRIPENRFFQNKTATNLTLAQRRGNTLVVLQKNLGSYFSPLALFALFFILFLFFIFSLVLLHSLWPVLPDFLIGIFQIRQSLKNRIQLAVIGIVLGSSVVIGAVTVGYFKSTAHLEEQQAALRTMKTLQHAWSPVENLNVLQAAIKDTLARNPLNEQTSTFLLYNRFGQLIGANKNELDHPQWMSAAALEALKVQMQPYGFYSMKQQGTTLYTTLKNEKGQLLAYLALPKTQENASQQQKINNFVGSIFSLYVFFMFIAGGIAIWVANSITEPISKIGAGLSQLQLEANVPLVWKNEDEIGLLIQQYNLALKKLEESSRQLRLSEREGAWREMAKQVAHEIKNPLTPMKLSVQHLLRAYQLNPETVGPLIQRVSHTLIEQIEGLTKIADEFAHFAKMPKAKLERVLLNDIVKSVLDLYRNQADHTQLKLDLPEESLFVKVDKDQLIRVFNNLITNALQAIPDGREGRINVQIEKVKRKVKISISDNGSGIPVELQHQVFYPNFTTKSSGTGIGLSLSRKIIEQFDGEIYFETRNNVGTTFYIDLEAA